MAVSLNAGGYMRSDYMISDAAIPMRMEELRQEQTTEFSSLLSGFGDNTQSPAQELVQPQNDGSGDISDVVLVESKSAETVPTEMTNVKTDFDKTSEKAMDSEIMSELAAIKELNSEPIVENEEKAPEVETNVAAQQAVAVLAQEAVVVVEEEPSDYVEPVEVETEIVQAEETPKQEAEVVTAQNDDLSENEPIYSETVSEELTETVQTTEKSETIVETEADEEPIAEKAEADEKPKAEEKSETTDLTANIENTDATAVYEAVSQTMTEEVVVNTQDVQPKVEAVGSKPVQGAGREAVKSETDYTAAETQSVVVTQTSGTKSDSSDNSDNGLSEQFAAQSTESAVKTDDVRQSEEIPAFEVKTTVRNASEQRDFSDKTDYSEKSENAFDTNGTAFARERVTSASDELAMIKSARSAVKTDDAEQEAEQAVGEKTEPTETANPLMTDTPIILNRDNGETVEVKPSEVVSQAEAKLVETAKEMPQGDTEYSVVLNPEELGKITVKLTKAADGAVAVTISAEKDTTRQILEQNSSLMQSNLKSGGIRLESWQTVREAERETYAQDYNGSSKNPYYRENDEQRQDSDDSEEMSFAELIASM